MARLDGKVAVITGGASGIGAATSRLFVQEGARVVIADILDAHGEKLASELSEAATFKHTDVTNEDDIRDAIQLAVSKYGRLDCMYNNAGAGGTSAAIADTPADGARQTIDLLFTAAVLGMKHAVPVMRAQKSGSIISTASVAGIGVGYAAHLYSACKAAVIQLTRSVANEVGEDGIRVNCIAPGAIPTPIFGKGAGMDQDAAMSLVPILQEGMKTAQPIPRAGRPEDIAEAAAWLASDASGFVTAHCLVVDGGLTTGKLWSQKMAELAAMGG